jgi:rfaE bifunctional protein kinase chain/domain
MLVSDYGYGAASPEIVRAIRGNKAWPAPVVLDSRYRMEEFGGLGLTAATPNEAELEEVHHVGRAPDSAQLEKMARRTMTRMGLQGIVVTRGRDGMMVIDRGRGAHSLEVFGSNQAVDVTGAGDTVIAVFCLAIAAGATMLDAAQLANYAGGIVVMKRGTATVTREELLNAIDADATGSGNPPKQ